MKRTKSWEEIIERFRELKYVTGSSKSWSYHVAIEFASNGDIIVTMGTYDVENWPSSIELGPYNSEERAKEAVEKKIEEARKVVYNEAHKND